MLRIGDCVPIPAPGPTVCCLMSVFGPINNDDYIQVMNPKELETIKKAAGHMEIALQVMEKILEATNNRPLYLAMGSMVEGLRHLHETDPTLLNPESHARVEALLEKEKPKPGRDSFNTGF